MPADHRQGRLGGSEGEFVADGSEQYIIIGAFPPQAWEATKGGGWADNQRAYYFVDGIS